MDIDWTAVEVGVGVGVASVLSLASVAATFGRGPAFAVGFTTSIAAAWSPYEWRHPEIHVRCPTSVYARWVPCHHLAHHVTEPRKNYGVTCPIWDVVFGTYVGVTKVRIPRTQAPLIPWLDGPEPAELLGIDAA